MLVPRNLFGSRGCGLCTLATYSGERVCEPARITGDVGFEQLAQLRGSLLRGLDELIFVVVYRVLCLELLEVVLLEERYGALCRRDAEAQLEQCLMCHFQA